MKKTLSKNSISEIYDLLATAKMAKMQTSDKFALLRIANSLKPEATAFKDFVKDAQERLKPSDWDDTIEKTQRFASLTPDEKAAVNNAVNNFSQSVNECVKLEADKEVEIEFAPLSEESLGRLLDSNDDWSVEKAVLIQDTFAK